MAQAGPIALPGATYPVEAARPVTAPQPGGIGASDLPSRTLVSFSPPPPARGGENGPGLTAPVLGPTGWIGDGRRSQPVNNNAAPAVDVANTLGHNTIAWSRPVYANTAGTMGFVPPTGGTSWSANQTINAAARPGSALPMDAKRIDNGTIREEYGSTRALFPGTPNRTSQQQGLALSGRRRQVQAKTTNPYFDALTLYRNVPAYGQTLPILGGAY